MCAEKVREYRVGEKVADFALPDLNGKTISLSDFKKKVVLVVVISHW